MPRAVVSDISLAITGTKSFSFKREKEINSAQVTSNSLHQQVSEEEATTEAQVTRKSSLKLPALTKPRRLSKEDKDDLQVLLQIRCFDCPLQIQALEPGTRKSSKSSHCSDDSQSSDDSQTSKDSSLSTKVNHRENVRERHSGFKDESFLLPLPPSTVLEGQRVNLREKYGLNSQGKQTYCQPSKTENNLVCQNDSSSDNNHIENITSKIISFKRRKEDTRPVFHLPKVDNYDITPGNLTNDKAFSVFNLNGVKSSPIYSSFRGSWVPHRDKPFMNNSAFFEAFLQQPAVLLRQPSPIAGVKMTLKEHEDSLVAAIQVVKETNVETSTVDPVLTQKVKKIVVRLPPIC